jgi:uncharacterized membrane protein YgaE (UPF0421/DUF939 family)
VRGDSLRKRAARIDRSYTRIAVATSVAAFLAYVLANALPLASAAVPAAITAVVATQASFHQATKGAFIQVVGALLGAAVALGIVSVIGSSALTILLLVALCFVVARLLHVASPDESPLVAAALAVTVILVIGTNLTTELAVERFVGIVIGALFAVIASFVASPAKATRDLEDTADQIQVKLGELLERIATELRTNPDANTVRGWFDQAVELRNQVLGLAAGLEDLKKNRRWSVRVTRADIAAVQAEVDACQIMSTRALSLASDLRRASAGAGSSPALPPAALSPLADLIAATAANMATDDPTRTVGRTAAHQAVKEAERTAQLALIGGIVSHMEMINQARVDEESARDEGNRPGAT